MEYKVLSAIRHNLNEYKTGDVIKDMDEATAKGLVDLKVLEPVVKGQAKQDVNTVENQVKQDQEVAATAAAEAPANEAPLAPDSQDSSSQSIVEDQAEKDLQESIKDNEKLANTPGEPVSHQPTPEEVAATAASVN